jgi:hypothetical protein
MVATKKTNHVSIFKQSMLNRLKSVYSLPLKTSIRIRQCKNNNNMIVGCQRLTTMMHRQRFLSTDADTTATTATSSSNNDNNDTNNSTTTKKNKAMVEWSYNCLRPERIEATNVCDALRSYRDDVLADVANNSVKKASSVLSRTLTGFEGWVVPVVRVDTSLQKPGVHVPLTPNRALCLAVDDEKRVDLFTDHALYELWHTPERVGALIERGVMQRPTQLSYENVPGLPLFTSLRLAMFTNVVTQINVDGQPLPDIMRNDAAPLQRTISARTIERAARVVALHNDRLAAYREATFDMMLRHARYYVTRANTELAAAGWRRGVYAFTDEHLLLDATRAALGSSNNNNSSSSDEPPAYDEMHGAQLVQAMTRMDEAQLARFDLVLNANTPLELAIPCAALRQLYIEQQARFAKARK